MKEAVVIYIPALHKGFLDFFGKSENGIDTIFLINEETTKQFDPDFAWLMEKDLRALSATEMQKALRALGISKHVEILTDQNLKGFTIVIIPENDEIVERVMQEWYPSIGLIRKKWFIRWDRKTVLSQRLPVANANISTSELDKQIMLKAFKLAEQSSDWWRQVGVIIFPVNAEPIFGFNSHLPHPQAPYINGDPRTNFKPGEFIDLSTSGHAEATAIGYAAKKGIALEGASIYVTVFPCPACAWLIINSGFKKVYYCEGFSQMHAVETLNARGIEVIFVDVPK